MEENKELIIVKQLPIIEERLKELSTEIDTKVANALSLVVSDETVKEVKKVRADLTKDFKDLEEQRKMVKEKVLAPYQAFEEIYKTYVSEKFKSADIELKNKIDEVETRQKELKEQEVGAYYNEYAISEDLEWLVNDKYYQLANINITLSASMKSLREQAKEFIDKVADDLKLIDTQENKEEILVEYKKDLNVSKSITEVSNRHKQLEVIKEEIKKQEEVKATEEKIIAKVEEVIKPIEKEKEYCVSFKVYGTKEQLLKLKEFLNNGGYRYE